MAKNKDIVKTKYKVGDLFRAESPICLTTKTGDNEDMSSGDYFILIDNTCHDDILFRDPEKFGYSFVTQKTGKIFSWSYEGFESNVQSKVVSHVA